MNFLEITQLFEEKIQADFEFELIEMHYIPRALDSGMKSYRINGWNIQIVYDGRDEFIEAQISKRNEKYDSANWTCIYVGTRSDFVEKGIEELRTRIKM